MFLVSSALHAWSIFCFNAPLTAGRVLKNLLKRLPAVVNDSSLLTMQGVVALHIKQYGEYRLPILKGRPEFLQKTHTFCNYLLWTMRGVTTLRIKQYREYQLFARNNGKESSKNCNYFLEFEIWYQVVGLEEIHSWKNQRQKSRCGGLGISWSTLSFFNIIFCTPSKNK